MSAPVPIVVAKNWHGPPDGMYVDGSWTGNVPIPPEHWPYGPPDFHQPACVLFAGGRSCDCLASDASDDEWGVGA